MKNRMIVLGIGIIFAILVLLLVLFYKRKEELPIDNEIIYLSEKEYDFINDDYYIFSDYTDYMNKVNDDILIDSNFDNNNYALVRITYDLCNEEEFKIASYNIKDNVLTLKVNYKASCGICAPKYYNYLLKIDKNIIVDKVSIDYEATNKVSCNPNVSYKPLIYLYPEKATNISVKLGNSENIIVSYPKYNNGWNIKAFSDGTLIDSNNKEYYGLYWEGNNHITGIKDDGFIVEGKDTIKFLEEKLNTLGLTERESNEFIIYWLPKLEMNKYNYIRFETLDEINSYMPLIIEPQPDTLIRVLMDYKPLDKKINVNEQQLSTPIRNGFTVVEWGGSEIN